MRKPVLIILLIIASVFLVYSSLTKQKAGEKDRAVALYEQGVEKIGEKDYTEAVELFTRAIELDPGHEKAYSKRGAVRAEFLRQYKAALSDLDKAIELNPGNAVALHNRGLCKISLNDTESAVEDFTRAIKKSPAYYIAHNSRGVAQGMLGKYEEAIKDFNSALIINPDYFNARVNMIFAKIQMEKYDEALAEAKKALESVDEAEEPENYAKIREMIDRIESD